MTVNLQTKDPIADLFSRLWVTPERQLDLRPYFTSGSPASDIESIPGTAYGIVLNRPLRKKGPEVDYFTGVTGSAVTPPLFLAEQTSATNPDNEMALLAAVAEEGDELAFIEVANAIDWNKRSQEEYIYAIRLALSAGAYLKAYKLSLQGVEQHPADSELQKFARILAPPKILQNPEPPDPTLRMNRDWLMTHWKEYHGRWVALKAGQLLSDAATFKELIEIIGDPKGKHILVTQV
jgi:hypothetical protein